MPKDGRRPFTEIVEVAQRELVREGATGEEAKYKGFVNQVYMDDLPSLLPERFLKKEAFITTIADYTAGTVTVGSATNGIEGASTSWTSSQSNMLLKVDGYDEVFRVTYSADTLFTFQNSLTWTGSSGSGLGYTLMQNRYQLASDFNYMVQDNPCDPCVVYRWNSGNKIFLYPWSEKDYKRSYNHQVSDLGFYAPVWEDETPYLYLWPNADIKENVGYDYIPLLSEMAEYTSGTATFNTTTAVTISVASLTTALNSANVYYIRNDADGIGSESLWFKVSSFGSAAVTLSAAFTGTTGTGVSYTISEVSKWPARFDSALLWKAAYLVDPDNVQGPKWLNEFSTAVALDRTTERKRKSGQQLRHFPGMRK